MADFLLIHGAWHGAWCWREVAARFEVRGHTATAIDLPGHGEDRSPPESVTLQNYVTCVVEALDHAIDRPGRPDLSGHLLYSIDTDHAPFFSAPDELTSILHTIAEQS